MAETSVILNNENELSSLLHCVQQHYPIGLPELYDHPRASNTRDLLISDMIKKANTKEATPWTELLADVSRHLHKFTTNYRQAPCYSFFVPIIAEKEIIAGTRYRRDLFLFVSLLCPYYTQFFADHYRFDGMKPSDKELTPNFRMLSGEIGQREQTGKMAFEVINSLVSHHFSDYQYINHTTLFDKKIYSGIRLEGQGIAGNYPIFSFLFDDTFSLENLNVLP
ncbi:hypothetical protein HF324_27645 [Chitinophaga oryzae]|uniref:Uncharacterized protein n=1 Tax=Chitinophaga oryzae TaxID=2725414 RepID=A0AAE6ZKG5_9BACT|nr:hypothetical protein [Chitinophaga oryzae]QJB34899.1 hypothetical protein HF329_27785 [Chitinophaga oryzae]QJB41410.1 hypothetical protein HF324_27645 [Chitinophaga oryzae]